MAAAGVTQPGWPTRARLLAADLIAFDPSRLGWALALRTTLGLALPLLLAHALDQPRLVWIGLGAYLLAIGDSTDDGDRAQPMRIVVGAVLGGLALATGVLAGVSLVTALAGMMVWGLLTGMMGVFGNALAAMSLPIAWAYVELGLPAADHTLTNALLMGGLFALGGLLTLLLTLTLRFGGTFAPVRRRLRPVFENSPAIWKRLEKKVWTCPSRACVARSRKPDASLRRRGKPPMAPAVSTSALWC